jgi:autotransporter passenger strand-loop-strand repeat protein
MSVTYYYETTNGLTSAATSTVSAMTIVSDQLMVVTSGSTVTSPVLLTSAADLTGSGSAVSNPGDGQWVYNGGTVTISGISEPVVGGAALVTSGGIVISAYVEDGAGLFVEGGTTSGSLISGGYESVFSGGLASGSIVSAGSQSVFSGGTAISATVDSGSYQEVYGGGTATSATISGYGTQDIWSGGNASATVIEAGGTQVVHAGGSSVVNDNVGGTSWIYGKDEQANITSGGVENVMSGGLATGSVIVSGGTQVISAGGLAAGAAVEQQGVQTIASGGTANNSQLYGGIVNVLSGGVLVNLSMSATGGEVVVSAGGLEYNGLTNGGLIEVLTGGTVSGNVLDGGQELLMGGTATGTILYTGGSEVVISGTSIDATVNSGGSMIVYAGGTAENVHVNAGGTISLASGANIEGDIVLSGTGAKVQFVGTTLAAATIDGLTVGDTIDLANIAGGTSATYNGTDLVVTNASGAVIADIALGTIPGGIFAVGSDSGSGTLITVDANIQTAAAAVADYTAGTLWSQVTVTDSAADISANLSGLESIAAAGKLADITLTDSGYATLWVTASQLSSDSLALNDITGNLILEVDATTASNVTITGLSGHATVVNFSGTASQYAVTAVGDGSSVTVSGTSIGTDHISNATILHFSDFNEVLAAGTAASGTTLSAANVAELYAAGLGRAPDAAGLSYYENLIKANPTLTAATLATSFLSSPEYTAAHSYAQTSAGDAQFVSDLYTNMLHRSGSTAEVSYYTNIINTFTSGLTAGTTAYTTAELNAHAVVLADFSASAEFLSNIEITAQHPASSQHWLVLL